jgi:hypothetical protein
MGELTGMRVDVQGRKLALTLTGGEITARIDKPLEADEAFTVHVGTMVMGVRGTEFTVRLDADNIVTVSVEHGIVAVMDLRGNDIAVLTEGMTEQFDAGTAAPVTGEGTPPPTTEPPPETTAPPTADPTAEPSPTPTTEPTADPTAMPEPSPTPTGAPTTAPTTEPTTQPTATPTVTPTPTAEPTPNPTLDGNGVLSGTYNGMSWNYEGELKSGIPDGNGVFQLTYANGNTVRYEGAWKTGNPNGQGNMQTLYASGSTTSITYTGTFVDGYLDGSMTYTGVYTVGPASSTWVFNVNMGKATQSQVASQAGDNNLDIPAEATFGVPPWTSGGSPW